MTTIATDGVMIVCDGLGSTDSGFVMERGLRKIEAYPGVIYGFAGETRMQRVVIDWHRNGAVPEHYPHKGEIDGGTLLVITDKSASVYHCNPYPDPCEFPVAIGTGRTIAMVAFRLGKTPIEAVQLAAELDLWTGGNIQVVRVADYIGQRSSGMNGGLNGHSPEGYSHADQAT